MSDDSVTVSCDHVTFGSVRSVTVHVKEIKVCSDTDCTDATSITLGGPIAIESKQ